MKKVYLIYMVAVAVITSCSLENDMMLPTDPATIEMFEVQGQVNCSINAQKRLVTVSMPENTSLKTLTLNKVAYSESTRLEDRDFPVLQAGDKLDLSDTLTVMLKSYRLFEWKLIAKNEKAEVDPQPAPQLYNMSFDDWTFVDNKTWYMYAEDATDEQKSIWTSANPGVALMNKNTTTPEESFLAVQGEGHKAAKLNSQFVVLKFAAATLFTGEFIKLNGMSGAEIAWGVPFNSRPNSLKGYYCYQPVAIDRTDSNHSDMKGRMDIGQISVILADWDPANPYEGYPEGAIDDQGRFHVINNAGQFVDFENDPAIIGYANYEFSESMENYEEFELKIDYRNERTPKVVVVVCASSRYGDYFTGGTGSTLYVDDFSFCY